MNITELIKQLEELREKYGDLPVYLHAESTRGMSNFQIDKITYDKYMGHEYISVQYR